jgi:hypothetical protein
MKGILLHGSIITKRKPTILLRIELQKPNRRVQGSLGVQVQEIAQRIQPEQLPPRKHVSPTDAPREALEVVLRSPESQILSSRRTRLTLQIRRE